MREGVEVWSHEGRCGGVESLRRTMSPPQPKDNFVTSNMCNHIHIED